MTIGIILLETLVSSEY